MNNGFFTWFKMSGIKILITIVIIYGLIRLFHYLIKLYVLRKKEKISDEDRKRRETIAQVFRYFVNIFLSVIGLMIVLDQFGIAIGPLLAGAGVAGVAIGFGAQALIHDYLNGIFIILEDQYRVGDVVNIGDKGGVVEKITLRQTVLRDLEGIVHFIPNSEIKIVSNLTKEWSRVVLDIGISYSSDINHTFEVLKKIGKELRVDPELKDLILDDLEILGVDNIGEYQIVIKIMIKCKPTTQWTIARALRKKIKETFDKEKIEIPFPYQVHLTKVEMVSPDIEKLKQ